MIKVKYSWKTCFSMLLVVAALIGVQLTTMGSVSGQQEEMTIIVVGQDGQDGQDGLTDTGNNGTDIDGEDGADGADGLESIGRSQLIGPIK